MSWFEHQQEKARAKARVDTLRDLLLFKFGTIEADQVARIEAATPEVFHRYLERLLTANSLAAVFADESLSCAR